MNEKGDVKGLIESLNRCENMPVREDITRRRKAARSLHEISAREPDKIRSTRFALSTSEKLLVKQLRNEDRGLRIEVAGILENIGWKPSNEKEELAFLEAKENISDLEKLGPPAVRALMSMVENVQVASMFPRSKRYPDANSVAMEAIASLEKIGDPIAVVTVLDFLDHEADRLNEDQITTVVRSLAQMGKSDINTLCEVLLDDDLDITNKRRVNWVLRALCETGDTRRADVALDVVFRDRASACTDSAGYVISAADFIRSSVPEHSLEMMFGDYTEFVLGSCSWKLNGRYQEQQLLYYPNVKFDLSECVAAVSALCSIKTPVSSNLLDRVKNRKTLIVSATTTGEGYVQTTNRSYIDFSELAELAGTELALRGNPKYDKKAYTVSGAWGIPHRDQA
jgi:hypothetical protein